MSNELVLEEVKESGNVEFARLESGEVVIGREPSQGIAFDRHAISREHGCFLRASAHWFYRDLGSTNGSWLNGQKIEDQLWHLIRTGDFLQLADVPVKISTNGTGGMAFPSQRAHSLIIFLRGRFVDEFPVPEYGRALMVGGSSGDIDIPGDVSEEPSLVVERRGDEVCVFQVARQVVAYVNGEQVGQTKNVSDRDVLSISDYTIVLNAPSGRPAAAPGAAPEVGPSSIQGWGTSPSAPDLQPTSNFEPELTTRTNIPFGQPRDPELDGEDATMAIDPDEMGTIVGMDMHPSMRSVLDDTTGTYSFRSFEDKVILVIGLLLMLLLVFLVVWWVFAS